jgi:hypothetical protein
VWLTVADCARRDDVVLITANSTDFADPDNPEHPAEDLRADLEARGILPARVRIVDDIQAFHREFIEPSERATRRAEELLADPGRRRSLVAQISLAAAWFPRAAGEEDEWSLGLPVDEFALKAFDADRLELVSAEEGPDGALYLELRATGEATFDFFANKVDAHELPDDSPVDIWDRDWNDWTVLAEAVLVAVAQVEVRTEDGERFDVAFESVDPP